MGTPGGLSTVIQGRILLGSYLQAAQVPGWQRGLQISFSLGAGMEGGVGAQPLSLFPTASLALGLEETGWGGGDSAPSFVPPEGKHPTGGHVVRNPNT